jgi:hypothetical protein
VNHGKDATDSPGETKPDNKAAGLHVSTKTPQGRRKKKDKSLMDFDEPKPVEPEHHETSEKRLRHQILKRIQNARRPAGSPILAFQLDFSGAVTLDTANCPKVAQSSISARLILYVGGNNETTGHCQQQSLPASHDR